MAGHSKFKNIMHRKGAQDKKRAKVFTKIIRELTVAAKAGGGDPESNPGLRLAISNAKAANMPKDTMERAIKKGAGGDDGADYLETRYEGYGPSGVAVIVEVLTDNKNRSASDIRSCFSKYGGNMGEDGSVSFMFDRLGAIEYAADVASEDEMFEHAIEAGADNVESDADSHEITCDANDLHTVREALVAKLGDPASAKLIWKPQNTIAVEGDKAKSVLKLIDMLEDNDDVQNVYANFDIPEDQLAELMG